MDGLKRHFSLFGFRGNHLKNRPQFLDNDVECDHRVLCLIKINISETGVIVVHAVK